MKLDLYKIAKPLLFQMDPEKAHHMGTFFLKHTPAIATCYSSKIPSHLSLAYTCSELSFRTPFGMAAGFDKDAQCLNFFQNLKACSHIEIGTLTREAQAGNPKPRIWRYPNKLSLRNAMGFPNKGSQAAKRQLNSFSKKTSFTLGLNIGKLKDSNLDQSFEEYAHMIQNLGSYADYLTINLSSPNTPGLKDTQSPQTIHMIDQLLKKENCNKPALIKLSPDLNKDKLNAIVESILETHKIKGIIATNTLPKKELGIGGCSGNIIRQEAHETRHHIGSILKHHNINMEDFLFIGCGGISTYEDVVDHWKNWGNLIQLYTAFIYEGPSVFTKLCKDLSEDLQNKKCNTSSELMELYRS